jgi:tRNA-specific 2-thiouridylase
MAMSGGVDSAVAALLLKEKYDITGVTMRLWSEDGLLPDSDDCPPDQNVIDAREVARLLGFEHISLALGESFRQCVVDRFIADYRRGATPNPCVECNRQIKFGKLFELADKMGIPYLATGHYARIVRTEDGGYLLKQAADKTKDQSYFLWSIKKERLPFILFPLGDSSKSEIRSIAAENGLPSASRSDSQDICFIPDGDYASFIQRYDKKGFCDGNFVDLNGNILGRHQGIERYTVGQRKGLGIALGVPMFVCKKNVADNSVTLCSDSELYSDTLTAHSINLLTDQTLETPTRLTAKIRYRHTPATATVQRIDEDRISVRFDQPQRAIASGQSVVLYDGDTVVGGGIIE